VAMSEMTEKVDISHLKYVVFGLITDPEPIDLAHVVRWGCWTYDGFKCLFCDKMCDYSYEVHFQWGDTPRYTYVSEMCGRCLSIVCKKSRNATTSRYVLDD
jgi:hypothetical protein